VPWDPAGSLHVLPGVGPTTAARLEAAGLRTLVDLLQFFPRRAKALTELVTPAEEAEGQLVRIRGAVRGARLNWLPGRKSMVTVEFVARDGAVFGAQFFNQPWLRNAWPAGTERVVEGQLVRKGKKWLLKVPRVLAADTAPTGGVQLHYPEIEGIAGARLQHWIQLAIRNVDGSRLVLPPLPGDLEEHDAPLHQLLCAMHQPADVEQHEHARLHFALREAVHLFRRVERARRQRAGRAGIVVEVDGRLRERILKRIPFVLTAGQQHAVEEVFARMRGPAPMGVLLQGDVGTGKTAVAVCASLAAVARGAQVAFLAPTELLAEQHHEVVSRWLAGSEVRVELLTGSRKPAERRLVEQGLASGAVHIVFGTHALMSESTSFHRLGLVVVDEQHRFGVAQRMQLVRKGADPHVLVMTATPIPRTLTLTMFGDLDALVLRERPPGRRLVRAHFLPQARWPRALRSVEGAVARGEGVFVVCPAVGEEGEKGGAVRMHATLAPRFRCGLVHGRMPAQERQAVLDAFRRREFDVLVGTTVLEVGVDVPHATLMVVAGADRFGLATLHQLRGRVGRGTRRGLCIVCGEDSPRLRALCSTTDGFVLAEQDLRIRGSGELLGTAQSGFSELRALDPVEDLELLSRARQAVKDEP